MNDLIAALCGFVLAALIAILLHVAIKEQEQWNKFKVDHKCHIVERASSTVSTGMATTIGPKGQVLITPITTVTPEKIAYACDDGITYWR